jgi:hypothetical protein
MTYIQAVLLIAANSVAGSPLYSTLRLQFSFDKMAPMLMMGCGATTWHQAKLRYDIWETCSADSSFDGGVSPPHRPTLALQVREGGAGAIFSTEISTGLIILSFYSYNSLSYRLTQQT